MGNPKQTVRSHLRGYLWSLDVHRPVASAFQFDECQSFVSASRARSRAVLIEANAVRNKNKDEVKRHTKSQLRFGRSQQTSTRFEKNPCGASGQKKNGAAADGGRKKANSRVSNVAGAPRGQLSRERWINASNAK